MMETARDVCGESRGQRPRERKTWWWCEEVQQGIKEERDAEEKLDEIMGDIKNWMEVKQLKLNEDKTVFTCGKVECSKETCNHNSGNPWYHYESDKHVQRPRSLT